MKSPQDIRVSPWIGRCDTVMVGLLLGAIAFALAAFGAVEAWSEEVLCVLSTVALLTLATKLLLVGRFAGTWLLLPVLGLIMLPLLQLVPLPSGWLAAISPATAEMHSQYSSSTAAEPVPLSLYPQATWHDWRMAVMAASFFVVAVNCLRQANVIRRFVGVLTIIGTLAALLALAQIATGTDRIYWLVPSGHQLADAGTMVNHSNFSQFVSMTLGCAFGLLLARMHAQLRQTSWTLPSLLTAFAGRRGRVNWLLLLSMAVCSAAVFLSFSRGGVISLMIALTCTIVVMAVRRSLSGKGWLLTMVAMGAFLCVLVLGFDAVCDRLGSLRGPSADAGRWQILHDLTAMWGRFPLLGTGLGTHAYVFPAFDQSSISAWAFHAENEYAQLAEETGVIGLAFGLSLLVMAGWHYWRSTRQIPQPMASQAGQNGTVPELSLGLGIGLTTVTLHSLSDFGLHIPAVSITAAALLAILVSISQRAVGQAASDVDPSANPKWSRISLGGAAMAAALLVAIVLSIPDVDRARRADSSFQQALQIEEPLSQNSWDGDDATYARLILLAQDACQLQPLDVQYQYWLNVYRWRSITRDSQTVPAPQVQYASRIVQEMQAATNLCPTYGPMHSVIGQIRLQLIDEPEGRSDIDASCRLAPGDATVLMAGAAAELRGGNEQLGMARLQRALQLDSRMLGPALDLLLSEKRRTDLALAATHSQPWWLFQTLDRMDRQGRQAMQNREVVDCELPVVLEWAQSDRPAAILARIAELCARRQQLQHSESLYRRALAKDASQVQWRVCLARVLVDSGQKEQARRELDIALRQRPELNAARRLRNQLVQTGTPGMPSR